ncbi:hypothetical protein JAAARDRAFT_192910 [Jaapia argillacea MUCL 33604]|uniref:F-box domain-containing protein n=1 Tax=Jaapia argillacea MUCL 33604 TaxID=933084 RepID=A0A067PU28_9AGAM|nr:hypothetical protein JAAARDRAFT_192910 [Jaapia argillacea MUCL 33604]
MVHHALRISEIVHEICGHLDPDSSPTWRSDLASMAVCCRSFQEPALEVLWRDMEDVEPLLRLIPDLQMLYVHRGGSWARSYTIATTQMTPIDWERFDYYARRVRSIDHKLDHSLCYDIFTQLASQRRGPLLPRLVEFAWSFLRGTRITVVELRPLLAFTSPPLRSLTLNGGEGTGMDDESWRHDVEFIQLLDQFVHSMPLLEELVLSGNLATLHVEFSRRLPNLRIIGVFPSETHWSLQEEGICSMASLQHLHSLSLLRCCVYRDSLPDTPSPIGFSSLENLFLSESKLTSLIYILDGLPVGRIQSIEAYTNADDPNEDEPRSLLIPVFERLSRFATSLTTLDLVLFARVYPSPADGSSNLMTFLGPLLSLRLLKFVHLGFDVAPEDGLIWADADIQRVACAWPHLVDVNFKIRTEGSSLSALQSFIDRCPDLEGLRFPQSTFTIRRYRSDGDTQDLSFGGRAPLSAGIDMGVLNQAFKWMLPVEVEVGSVEFEGVA